jgi:hypothetical protein
MTKRRSPPPPVGVTRLVQDEELGEPPTPEELLAFRDDQLSPERRESVEARLAFYPDAARALADLRAWPEVPGMPEISDEEIDAGWRAFLSRLEELCGR